MNHIAYLKRIRFLHYILLICAVALTALGTLMGGVGALAVAFIVVWRYHRCPKCGGNVDILLSLEKETLCPSCGCFLKDGAEPEPDPKAEGENKEKEREDPKTAQQSPENQQPVAEVAPQSEEKEKVA